MKIQWTTNALAFFSGPKYIVNSYEKCDKESAYVQGNTNYGDLYSINISISIELLIIHGSLVACARNFSFRHPPNRIAINMRRTTCVSQWDYLG